MTQFLALVLLSPVLAESVAANDEATLGRVSFWVPVERMAEFEATYAERALPLLRKHGIVATKPSDRVLPADVFDRLFEAHDIPDVRKKQAALRADPAWSALLIRFGSRFGAPQEGGPIRSDVRLFQAPLGEGTPAETEVTGVWRNFGVEEGLQGGSVFSFIHDRDGNMWFGTFGGVHSFDGQTWSHYTTKDGLGHNAVQAMMQDRDGVFWFGTRGGGVTRYDGQTWTTYTTRDGLAQDAVRAMAQGPDGDMWFGTRGGGVSRFDGETWTTYTSDNGLAGNVVYAMLADSEGNVWIGDYARGISRYDGSGFTRFTPAQGLKTPGVCRLFEDRDGGIWAGGCRLGGVSRYDGSRWTNYTTRDGLAANLAHGILQDRGGDMWFGTGNGVSRFDGSSWRSYREGIGNAIIWSSHTDRNGDSWFGTDSGASRWDEETWTSIHLGKQVVGVSRDPQGTFWFNSWGGLFRFDGERMTTFDVFPPRITGAASLRDQEGRMWFASMGGGIARLDGQTWSIYASQDGLASNALFAHTICQDQEGNLWFGTAAGVSRFDGRQFTSYGTAEGLAYSDVYSVWADGRGYLWFGTSNGLNRYDPSRPDRPFDTFRVADGLADPGVWSIAEELGGTLWFGGTGGVTRYEPDAPEGERFTPFTTEDGLVSNSVWAVHVDRGGQVWLGTGSGVSRYDGQVFQMITQQDGLLHSSVWDFFEDEDGAMWIATGAGVTRFRPPLANPPGIAVDAVVADQRYQDVDELSLTAPLQIVAFEYAARNDFDTRPEAMVYRYRLTGHQDEWQTTNARRLEFQDLPLGDYTFEVQAVDRDLVYSKPATVHLAVVLPFTQYGLVVALILAVGTVVFLGARVTGQARKLRLTNDTLTMTNTDLEKSRVAAEAANHAKSLFLANMSHEIRTPMNAILGYAQILQRNTTLERSQKRAVEIIQTSGDHLLKLINSVLDISKIEAGRLELDRADFDLHGLIQTVSMMFELQCREKGLSWELDSQITDRRMVVGDESKLRQILINLLGNAIKFTDEGRIGLHVTDHGNDHFGFAVSDSGSGMSAEEQKSVFEAFQQGKAGRREGGTGLGLAISQRQLALMDSDLQVESSEGNGSRFFFDLDLPASAVLTDDEAVVDWSHVERLAPGQTLKVLVVDDVAENRDILRHMLVDMGAEVRMANDGQQALDVLASWLPDIVFLDIRMPVMDGIEALQRIRQQPDWQGVKVAAISASALEHEREGYLEAGFVDFIDKPFRFERICSCLATLLGVRFDTSPDDLDAQQIEERDDWSAVSLPQDLAVRLTEAAELYSVTEMDGCFTEMESLGGAAGELATRLRSLRRKHDLDTIANIVQTVQRD